MIASVNFEQFAVVDHRLYHFHHVVRLVRVVGDYLVQGFFQTVYRVVARNDRSFFKVVRRQVAQQFAEHKYAFFVVFGHEMRNAGFRCMYACASEFFGRDVLAGNGFNYRRTGQEHV